MEEGKAKRQQVRFVQPEGLPSVYTNNARVQISYNDVKIYFSEATSEPGTQMLLVPGRDDAGTGHNGGRASLYDSFSRICALTANGFGIDH